MNTTISLSLVSSAACARRGPGCVKSCDCTGEAGRSGKRRRWRLTGRFSLRPRRNARLEATAHADGAVPSRTCRWKKGTLGAPAPQDRCAIRQRDGRDVRAARVEKGRDQPASTAPQAFEMTGEEHNNQSVPCSGTQPESIGRIPAAQSRCEASITTF